MRRLTAAVVLLVAALTACSGGDAGRGTATSTAVPTSALGTTTTPPTTAAASTVPSTTAATSGDRCTTPMLTMTSGEGRGALGHALYVLRLQNTSTRQCRMTGYPTVTLLDGGTGRVLAEAQPGAGYLLVDRPAAEVVVAPGSTAYVGVESNNVCAGGGDPSTSSTVKLTPPGTSGALTLAAQMDVCAGLPVRVSPVRATEREIAP